MKGVLLVTERLRIRDLPPRAARRVADFHTRNREFHGRWDPHRPASYYTVAGQRRVLRSRRRSPDALHLFLTLPGGEIVGVASLSNIVRGFLRSCFLGYKLDSSYEGQGYMREALTAVIDHAFVEMGLHRLEANIMPENARSIRLVRSLGFRDEGTAKRYLEIRGQWSDHVRMALLCEEWT